MSSLALDDQKKIGLGLTAFGVLFTALGVLLVFDRGLLAMGNLLFLAGVVTTIGPQAALAFFGKERNRKGSAFYLGGVALVILGWTFVGLAAEGYGFWLLFSAFFPTVLQFARRVPLLGRLLDLPGFKAIVNRVAPAGGLPTTSSGGGTAYGRV